MRSLLASAFALGLGVFPFLAACGDDEGGGDTTDDGDDGGDDGPGACGEIEGSCIELEPSGDGTDVDLVQTALIEAAPGDVILFHAGVYELDTGLSLDVSGVTLRGEGEAETVLSFAGQTNGAEGLLVTADDFTAEDLAVEDTIGDGIKVNGGARIVFRGVRVEWTGEPVEEHGAYGIYPVQCSDVLIEDSIVRGASDAGIYVGQSERAVVRGNTVELNVAGIEIENTFDADVYENIATGNTGGILVFNLPGLQVQNGAGTRVYDNDIFENNGPNFAPAGNTVAQVPPGTGFVALAAHEVEVFDNRFADNQTVQLGVISYHITLTKWDDPDYDPYSDSLYFHDNVFEGGGDLPSGLLGPVIRAELDALPEPPAVLPDIVIDGNFDPEKVDAKTGELLEEFSICIVDNDGADFFTLDFDGADFVAPNLDPTPHDCDREPLAPVVLEGVPL
ncbi:MAG TPA: parallel beta-helix domain-containing protein [Kofleriaceae bacterium]|nr:parallel beta-helix domain-containing protein [Kofleriaceae bacterium]